MSIAVFLLFGKLEQQRWLRAKILVKLSELSFGVYLVHWIVRHHTLGVFEQYYSVSYELWWYFAVSVIVILLSVIISWLISLLPWLKRDIR
jgi:peptidoglycan/LPS O-acetylase OafA/YrhL